MVRGGRDRRRPRAPQENGEDNSTFTTTTPHHTYFSLGSHYSHEKCQQICTLNAYFFPENMGFLRKMALNTHTQINEQFTGTQATIHLLNSQQSKKFISAPRLRTTELRSL